MEGRGKKDMKQCTNCNNDGSIIYVDKDGEERDDICAVCGGFGVIPETDEEKITFRRELLRIWK